MTTTGRVLPGRTIDVPSETFAIASDGRQIAYDSGIFSVSVRRIGASKPTAVVHRADDPAWSADSRRLAVDGYGPGAPHDISNIFTVQPGHAKQLFIREEGWDTDPTWSPDATEIAFERETPSGGIGSGHHTGIYISDGTRIRRLVSDVHGVALDPAWSPNGQQIAFDDTRHGRRIDGNRMSHIYVINADGTGLRQLTHDPKRDYEAPHWSADGQALAYTVSTPGDERSAVAIKTLGDANPSCALHPNWGYDWPIDWIPGQTAASTPGNCAHSLLPRRPKPRLDCSRTAAINAVDRSKLPLSVKSVAHKPPRYNFHYFCPDFTKDGVADLVVTFSGGVTGNTFRWAAFSRDRHDWHLTRTRTGDYMTLSERDHDILEKQPVVSYKCGFHFTGYHYYLYGWNGRHLTLVARWYSKT